MFLLASYIILIVLRHRHLKVDGHSEIMCMSVFETVYMQDMIENVDAKDMVDRLLNVPLMKLTINQKESLLLYIQANVKHSKQSKTILFQITLKYKCSVGHDVSPKYTRYY